MDFKELIAMINRNTAAQQEQNKKWRVELGLPEPEPTALDLLLQKWEVEMPSREPEEEEQPLPEPRGEELPLPEPRGEELPLPEPRGEEPPLPESRGEEPPLPDIVSRVLRSWFPQPSCCLTVRGYQKQITGKDKMYPPAASGAQRGGAAASGAQRGGAAASGAQRGGAAASGAQRGGAVASGAQRGGAEKHTSTTAPTSTPPKQSQFNCVVPPPVHPHFKKNPARSGITVSHTSAASSASRGVSVKGQLGFTVCLSPRIPFRVEEC
ncbi:UNVERIFIED_CONTAM: hypothetical protein FKN15_073462 [Acipenser sinensis]